MIFSTVQFGGVCGDVFLLKTGLGPFFDAGLP